MIHDYRLHLNRIASRGEGTLKKSTQNYHLIALRSFLKFLAKRDVPTLAPEKIELAKQGSRDVSFLESSDLARLLEAPDKSDAQPIIKLRDKAILETLTSIRRAGADLVLVGTSVARSSDPAAAVRFRYGQIVDVDLAALLLGLPLGRTLRLFARTLRDMTPSLLAVSFMVGLAYVTRYSGMDTVMGLSLTGTGRLFPFFGTMLGWLGVALTGTDAGSGKRSSSPEPRSRHCLRPFSSSPSRSSGVTSRPAWSPRSSERAY